MSDEEYSPESETEIETAGGFGFPMDAFIPLVLLSVGFIVLLGWQVSNTSSQRTQLESLITRQEPSVNQAQQLQASLGKLAGDLLKAAETDDTAKAIAAKYGIKQNGADGGAGTP
jgi:hypothetical protein